MNTSLPKVIITKDCWKKISAEVTKWAHYGEAKCGSPYEAVFYPMVSLQLHKESNITPFCDIELSDVAAFVVADVYIPPAEFTCYDVTSARFQTHDGNQEKMDLAFQDGLSAINRRDPRLLFFGPGHSHPFAINKTYPSSTDVNYHIRPYRRKNEELLGCRFSLALIVAKRSDRKDWQACAFAMNGREEVIDLGIAQILDRQDSSMRTALMRPYYQRIKGRAWETKQKNQLGKALLEFARWPGGWTTFMIEQDQDKAKLVIVPPDFPFTTILIQYISIKDRQVIKTIPLSLSHKYQNYQI